MKHLSLLFLFCFLSGCATASQVAPPAVELRTYRINEDTTDPLYLKSIVYQWRVNGKCTRKFLWKCTEREELIKKEIIPFDDQVSIKKFLDAGFVFKVREKP